MHEGGGPSSSALTRAQNGPLPLPRDRKVNSEQAQASSQNHTLVTCPNL